MGPNRPRMIPAKRLSAVIPDATADPETQGHGRTDERPLLARAGSDNDLSREVYCVLGMPVDDSIPQAFLSPPGAEAPSARIMNGSRKSLQNRGKRLLDAMIASCSRPRLYLGQPSTDSTHLALFNSSR